MASEFVKIDSNSVVIRKMDKQNSLVLILSYTSVSTSSVPKWFALTQTHSFLFLLLYVQNSSPWRKNLESCPSLNLAIIKNKGDDAKNNNI